MATEQAEGRPKVNYWITNYAALYNDDLRSRQMYLPIGSKVTLTGVSRWGELNGRALRFQQVKYVDGKGDHSGWVYDAYIEPLRISLPQNIIQLGTQTPNPQDANQYIQYQSTTQYNLCGPLAACYCTGWKTDNTDFLDTWKVKKPAAWKRIFGGGAGRGTDLGDLDAMFAEWEGYPSVMPRLSTALHDPLKGGPLVTPGRVGELLVRNRLIISCRIDAITGRLRGQGVLHWVVLEMVLPEGYGGLVHLYNPFVNGMEIYSWQELANSMGQPYGVVAER